MTDPQGPLLLQPLSPKAFEQVRARLLKRAGISLGDQKLVMVQARLGRRLKELGLSDYESYLHMLEDPDSEEWTHFTNALTTNVTHFFREAHHFEQLVEQLAPKVKAAPPGGAGLRIWSAGCATGEEPYSIALTLLRAFPGEADLRIVATDLDTQVLRTAATGIYPFEALERMDPALRTLGFQRGKGPQRHRVRVRPEVRELVRFYTHNLQGEAWPASPQFDAVFCRNVMIYFEKPQQHALIRRFHRCLLPGGVLFIGHSESMLGLQDLFRPLGRSAYLRLEVRP